MTTTNKPSISWIQYFDSYDVLNGPIPCAEHWDAGCSETCIFCIPNWTCKKHRPDYWRGNKLYKGLFDLWRLRIAGRAGCIDCFRVYIRDYEYYAKDAEQYMILDMQDQVLDAVIYGYDLDTTPLADKIRCLRVLYRLGWTCDHKFFNWLGTKLSAKQVREFLRAGFKMASCGYIMRIITARKWDHIRMVAKYSDEPNCQKLAAVYESLATRDVPDELINMIVDGIVNVFQDINCAEVI